MDNDTPPSPSDSFEGAEDSARGIGAADNELPGPESSGESFLIQALRSSSPHMPLSEVEGVAISDLARDWDKYLERCLLKASSVDNAEAWIDGVKAAIGLAVQIRRTSTAKGGSSSGAGNESGDDSGSGLVGAGDL